MKSIPTKGLFTTLVIFEMRIPALRASDVVM
jgi:hypothetical protein